MRPLARMLGLIVAMVKFAVRGRKLLQLRVLGFGLLQDGDVRVGVFPKREEVLVSHLSFDSIAGEGVGATKLEMGECAYGVAEHDPSVIENLLELDGSVLTLVCCKIGF